ncbi:hypothetical protein [Magnetospirillum fulvum]|uniref:hypothetical protein n=1 Tax=Magnetospirillum fulvum TaxID=1082 RepID=UPI0018C9CEFD|nr:hypothetical protein [Magnetospirillum fulvum]
MAQFVDDLGEPEGDAERHQTGGGQIIDEGGAEPVPLPDHEEQAEHQRRQGGPAKGGAAQPAHIGQQGVQHLVGPDQGNPEEQVMVQQPRGPRRLAGIMQLDQAIDVRAGLGLQQLAARHELDHVHHVVDLEMQGGFPADCRRHRLRVLQVPAAQDFEGRPGQTKIAIGQRVVQGPGRRTVIGGRTRQDRQFVAQSGQSQRGHGQKPRN